MKSINLITLMAMLAIGFHAAKAQTVNWNAFEPQQHHIISLHTGFDHGMEFGIGYGYKFNSKMPLILNIDFSAPSGDNLFDDFKTKIGGQLNVIHDGHFNTAIKAYGVFRRYENNMVRMLNFGSEFSATTGYYRDRWFVAGEFGFDKAVVTHIKHSALAQDYNPSIQNGWYLPTGGNFFYGLHGGYSFSGSEFYARIGKTVQQDFKSKSLIPAYLQLGWNLKMGSVGVKE